MIFTRFTYPALALAGILSTACAGTNEAAVLRTRNLPEELRARSNMDRYTGKEKRDLPKMALSRLMGRQSLMDCGEDSFICAATMSAVATPTTVFQSAANAAMTGAAPATTGSRAAMTPACLPAPSAAAPTTTAPMETFASMSKTKEHIAARMERAWLLSETTARLLQFCRIWRFSRTF